MKNKMQVDKLTISSMVEENWKMDDTESLCKRRH